MFDGLLVEVVLIFLLIVANGVFAAAEIAVVSARKGRLEQEAQHGQRGARIALELADDPNHFLSTVQVGITLIGTLAAAFGGARIAEVMAESLRTLPILAAYADGIALGIVVILISYFSLIIGELVPKRLALQSAEAIAIRLAPLMRFLGQITSPVVRFLTFSSELVLRLLRRHNVPETPITEDDVLALVREGMQEGTLEAAEADLIRSVFAFTERTVRTLMTPRTQVVALEVTRPLAEVVAIVTESGHSRIPVYQETLDTVIGILHVRDLLRTVGQSSAPSVNALLHPAIYIPETQRAVAAFQQLKHQRSGLMIVLDEYGQTAGIISMEDLLEELVGEMSDADQARTEAVVRREDGTYLIDGLLPFVDLAQQLHFPSSEAVMDEHDFEPSRVSSLRFWAAYRLWATAYNGNTIALKSSIWMASASISCWCARQRLMPVRKPKEFWQIRQYRRCQKCHPTRLKINRPSEAKVVKGREEATFARYIA
jgi:putative hemolysin